MPAAGVCLDCLGTPHATPTLAVDCLCTPRDPFSAAHNFGIILASAGQTANVRGQLGYQSGAWIGLRDRGGRQRTSTAVQCSMHGGRSWSGPDPKGGGGGLPPPSTDPKIVVRNNVLCRRLWRRRFCFRHRAGGNFFVPPYVSVLKILRISWRIQTWLKSTKKVFDPDPASGSDLG